MQFTTGIAVNAPLVRESFLEPRLLGESFPREYRGKTHRRDRRVRREDNARHVWSRASINAAERTVSPFSALHSPFRLLSSLRALRVLCGSTLLSFVLFFLLVSGLLLPGCQDPSTAPGQSPPAIVRAEETFELSEGENWLFRTPALWQVVEDGGRRFLRMAEPPPRAMLPGVRRVQEYAVFAPYEFRSFTLSCRLRVDRDPGTPFRDACILFGRQDDTHYYYAHLAGFSDSVHNTLMRVDGATRRRLLPESHLPPPVLTDHEWHKVDVLRNADTGAIQVFIDAFDPETATPYFEITDRTYEWGFIAVGSFDDFASFDHILIEGQARKPAAPPVMDQ